MKCNISRALSSAPKLFTAIALSALLVACGGGTSGDDPDGDNGFDTDGASTDGFGEGGDTDGDSLGLTGGDTDGDSLVSEFDDNGDGVPNEDEDKICKGLGGSDPGSNNELWGDNCWLRADIRSDIEGTQRGPFYHTTYGQGVQRILFCQGVAGAADSIDLFADGFFGPNTNDAVRDFQTNQGLIVDGIVGPGTWGKMQELVEDVANLVIADTDDAYNAYGITSVEGAPADCSQMTNFFGRFNTDPVSEDTFEAWEMSKSSGSSDKGSFSIAAP